MRRRKEELPAPVGTAPPELRVGPVAEVWAATSGDLLSARRRWHAARRAWLASSGLSPVEADRLLLGGSPWTVQGLIAAGREDEVRAMLARRGATLDQLGELRRRAQRWDQSPAGGGGAKDGLPRRQDRRVGGSQLAHPEMNCPTDALSGVLARPGEGDTA